MQIKTIEMKLIKFLILVSIIFISLFVHNTNAEADVITYQIIKDTETELEIHLNWKPTGLISPESWNGSMLENWSVDLIVSRPVPDFHNFNWLVIHNAAPHALDDPWGEPAEICGHVAHSLLAYTMPIPLIDETVQVDHPSFHYDTYHFVLTSPEAHRANIILTGIHHIPIPPAVWLLGSAFIALVGLRGKLKK